MSLLEETKEIIGIFGIIPKRLEGQNFLVDAAIFPTLAAYASLSSNDVVLDVGAGFGFLTRFLAGTCRLVFAVEKDPNVTRVLGEKLTGVTNVKIIEGDVLSVDMPHFDKVVSAPPYQISSSLMTWLFAHQFDCAVLVLQTEFAKKLVAKAGTEDYSWLTVYAYTFGMSELFDDISRHAFYPEPEVDSVVVRFTRQANPRFSLSNPGLFVQMLKQVFSERNKKLSNAILPFAENVLKLSTEDARKRISNLSFYDQRVRALEPEAFGELAHVLLD